jgi:hypothetical protein
MFFSLILPALIGCKEDIVLEYEQFNDVSDTLSVQVGVEKNTTPATIDLHSTTGQIIVGWAEMSPSAGPIGTKHTLVVNVDNRWEDEVSRVTIRTDSGSRGKDEYDMVTDSADEGLHQLELISVGSEGESRTDYFTVRLWKIKDQPFVPVDTGEEEEEEDTGGFFE